MLATTDAIVLSLQPYSDKAHVLHAYTRAGGRFSFRVYGICGPHMIMNKLYYVRKVKDGEDNEREKVSLTGIVYRGSELCGTDHHIWDSGAYMVRFLSEKFRKGNGRYRLFYVRS